MNELDEHEAADLAADNRTNAALKKDIGFGFDMQAFIRSDIGRYLVARGETEKHEALMGLAVVDPEDTKRIRELQFDIAVVDRWQGWIEDAVIAGEIAQKTYIDQG